MHFSWSRRRLALWLALLAGSVLSGPAAAQEESVDSPEQTQANEPRQRVDVDQWPAQKVIDQIQQVENVSGEGLLSQLSNDQGLVAWPMSLWIGSTNYYDTSGTRYLAVRLALANRSEQAIEVRREEIGVQVGMETWLAGEVPDDVRTYLHVDGTHKSPGELRTPDSVTIPPGQSVWFWCLFAPLPDTPEVPEMSLRISGANALEVSLNETARRRAALQLSKIGPRDCVGLLEVRGHLDAVSAAEVAKSLETLQAAGTQRAVIFWPESADNVDPMIFNWLVKTGTEESDDDEMLQSFPKLPRLRSFEVAQIPINLEEVDGEAFGHSHATPVQAVAAAIKDLGPWLPVEEVLQQIDQGHDWIRLALLSDEQVPLPPQAMTAIDRLLQGEAEEQRIAAIRGLARVDDSRAAQRLAALVKDHGDEEDSPLAIAALSGLIGRSRPGTAEQIEQMLEDGSLPRKPWVIAVVAESAEPAFTSWLESCLQDAQASVRLAALEGFSIAGHEHLVEFATRALLDEESNVRQRAFGMLAASTSRAARATAVEHALATFDGIDLDYDLRQLIENSGDPRFETPLLDRLRENPAEVQPEVVSLLLQIGGTHSLDEIVRLFPQFSEEAKLSTLPLLAEWSVASAVSLAEQSIGSQNPELATAAAQVLLTDHTEASINLLISAFDASYSGDVDDEEYTAASLSYVICQSSDPRLRAALARFRDAAYEKKNQDQLRIALNALANIRETSPASSALSAAMYRSMEDEHEQAVEYYKMAIEIDPLLSVAHAGLGNAYLKLDRLNESDDSYQRALELDPFDDQALTGVGLLMARNGRPQEAVKFIVDNADRCPNNYIFEYNTACVYGRAVENLRTHPRTEERDKLIQEWGAKGVAHLATSIRMDFDDMALMNADPDLHALRDFPGFGTAEGVEN